MKRSSSAAAPVAAAAMFDDTSAAEVRPAIIVRRLGSRDETPNAEQSSQQVMCEFSPEPRLRLLFVAVRQSQKYQDAEDQLVVKRKAIATWRDIRGRRPESRKKPTVRPATAAALRAIEGLRRGAEPPDQRHRTDGQQQGGQRLGRDDRWHKPPAKGSDW